MNVCVKRLLTQRDTSVLRIMKQNVMSVNVVSTDVFQKIVKVSKFHIDKHDN